MHTICFCDLIWCHLIHPPIINSRIRTQHSLMLVHSLRIFQRWRQTRRRWQNNFCCRRILERSNMRPTVVSTWLERTFRNNTNKRNRQHQTSACFHLVHNLNVNGFNFFSVFPFGHKCGGEKWRIECRCDTIPFDACDCYDQPLTHSLVTNKHLDTW